MRNTRKLQTREKQGLIVGAIAGLAVVVAVVAIVISSGGTTEGSGIDFTGDPGSDDVNIEMGRTDDGGHIIGDPDAPVTIVAFEDFLCPHCQDYKPTVNRILNDLVMTGRAKFEFRFLQTQGANAVYAFQLAECAGELEEGGFWVAHDQLFAVASERGRSLTQDDLRSSVTDAVDISAAEIIECTRDADQYETDQRYASRNNISRTPSLRLRYEDGGPLQVINNVETGGPSYEVIEATVDLAAAGQ